MNCKFQLKTESGAELCTGIFSIFYAACVWLLMLFTREMNPFTDEGYILFPAS